MKLRNKKTGEIEIVCPIYLQSQGEYNSLAELNEEWEDYEEPKGVKSIYFTGATVYIEMSNQKEAIEVEEKLKAWKRLKDKGFEFRNLRRYLLTDGGLDIRLSKSEYWEDEQVQADLDLLFGGEE